MSHYKTHKTDANQKEIVDYLKGIGASVQDLSEVGGGCPDILVGYKHVNFLFEIKMPNGNLTPAQWKWHDNWEGGYHIVESVEEVKRYITIRTGVINA